MNQHLRFFRKITVKDGCWQWNYVSVGGYGGFWNGKKFVRVHRFAYEMFFGKIPEGLQIDHLCRNRLCVNPDHLEAVTQKVNILRGIGVGARNARKTHCIRGHELSGENLNIQEGERHCRACKKITNALYKKRSPTNHINDHD